MIYDLKKLKDRNLRATEYGNPTSDFAVIRSEILLAIAERLEALVEAQKPRWVEFEYYDRDAKFFLAASSVRRVYETNTDFDRGVVLTLIGNDYYNVKGTLAEVMAKLRGEG